MYSKSKIKTQLEKIKIEYVVATFFGAGFFPKIPGTFASIVAFIPILLLPDFIRPVVLLTVVILLVFVSLPAIKKVETKHGSDAAIIVIDEVIGIFIIFSSPFIPITWLSFIFGIGLFRLFDILKPSIIGKINKKQGAFYVLLDDISAALIVLILLHFIYFILKFATFFKIINIFS